MEYLDEILVKLRKEGGEIGTAARAGDKKAKRIVEAYHLLYRCPGDPGAQALLMIAYKEWRGG